MLTLRSSSTSSPLPRLILESCEREKKVELVIKVFPALLETSAGVLTLSWECGMNARRVVNARHSELVAVL